MGKVDLSADPVHFGLVGPDESRGEELVAFLAARGLAWPFAGVPPVTFEEVMAQVECALDYLERAGP